MSDIYVLLSHLHISFLRPQSNLKSQTRSSDLMGFRIVWLYKRVVLVNMVGTGWLSKIDVSIASICYYPINSCDIATIALNRVKSAVGECE